MILDIFWTEWESVGMEMAAVFLDSVKQTLYLSQIDEAGDDEIDARLQP